MHLTKDGVACATLRTMRDSSALPPPRRIETAEILSIGTELTCGETRDTNAGELARSLTEVGVEVTRLTGLPDRRVAVEAAFRAALERVDLVVSTGGLGPTPDDLTRESIAAVCNEVPEVDPVLERWLRHLWERRGLPFSPINLKQAWRIPSASVIANANGTAPGWWVDRPDGRVVILLPGPPGEMRPMWQETLAGRLHERGLGTDRQVRTLRLTGVGESLVAERLGDDLLRQRNPEVTTYARWDAVDVRMAATTEPPTADRPGTSAAALLDAVEALVLDAVGDYVWARGTVTWPEAIGAELGRLGWTLAVREAGSGGALGALLRDQSWFVRSESLATAAVGSGPAAASEAAHAIRAASGASVGLALLARPRAGDTAITIAIETPTGARQRGVAVFRDGPLGHSRAALSAAGILLEVLRAARVSDEPPSPGVAGPAPRSRRGRAG